MLAFDVGDAGILGVAVAAFPNLTRAVSSVDLDAYTAGDAAEILFWNQEHYWASLGGQ